MNIFYALIMGVLQGLTEFLPVSSSGHLVLFSRITGITSSLYYDLILHLGSLFAVLIFERKQVLDIIRHPLCKKSKFLFVSCIFTVVIVLVFSGLIPSSFEGNALPFCFLVTAIVLFLGEKFPKSNAKSLSYASAITLGVAQGLAVFPGVSRSGTTYSVGNALGLEKEENLNFCFLLSVPVILGGALLSILSSSAVEVSFLCLLVGFCASFISAFCSLKLINKVFLGKGFTPFVVYLSLLSVFLTLNNFVFHLF